MSLPICLNTSTIRPVPVLDKIRLAAKAGFDGIELWIDELHDHVGKGGEIKDIAKALADNDLVVPCVIALKDWGDAPEDALEAALDDCRRRMELAHRVGSPLIVATPPRGPVDEVILEERYSRLLAIGREVGIRPAFEYISFFESARTLRDAWTIVERASLEDDHACLVVDSFHSWNSGSTLDDLREIPVERIAHWHVDDAPASPPQGEQRDPDRVLPGDGVIDLAAEVKHFRDADWEGTVSLELFSEALWARDPAEVLKEGRERLAKLFS